MDGNLTGLGLKDEALDTENVADVHLFESLVGLFTDLVAGDVDLMRPSRSWMLQKEALPMTRLNIIRPAMETSLPSNSS